MLFAEPAYVADLVTGFVVRAEHGGAPATPGDEGLLLSL